MSDEALDDDDDGPFDIVRNERTNRVAFLVGKLYEYPAGAVGGHCHIVTDDLNLDDDDIQFCLGELDKKNEYAFLGEPDPKMIEIERELLTLMLGMSMQERRSSLAIRDENERS